MRRGTTTPRWRIHLAGATATLAAVAITWSSAARAGDTSRGDDHTTVVGRYGVGALGTERVPNGADGVVAPLIGFRRWLPSAARPAFLRTPLIKTIGIEAAVGFGVDNTHGGGGDLTSFAVALHAGLPLALAHSGHFTFIAVPRATSSFSVGSAAQSLSLGVGARAGAEIHFGFMGIPQLTLQGTVGADLRFEQVWQQAGASSGRFRLGTSVGGQPWDIFTSNIAAIYYL
jgi:hypothetical protein